MGNPRVGQLVGHQLGLAVVQDPARHALVVAEGPCPVALGVHAARDHRAQLAGRRVVQVDGDVVHLHERPDAVGHHLQHGGRVEGGEDGLGHDQQLLLAAYPPLEGL